MSNEEKQVPGDSPGDQTAGDIKQTPEGGDGTQPEWMSDVPQSLVRETPEETLKEVAKAYKHARAAIGKGKTPESPGDLAIGDDDYDTDDENAAFSKLVQKAGLEISTKELNEQWSTTGKLTESQYKAFAKAGIPRALINGYMDGQTAKSKVVSLQTQQAVAEAQRIVGGKEQLDDLVDWARTNYDAAKLKKLSDIVTKDPSFYPEMMSIINAARGSKGGQPAKAGPISGSPAGNKPVTREEMGKLIARATKGDEDAIRKIDSMSPEVVARLYSEIGQ